MNSMYCLVKLSKFSSLQCFSPFIFFNGEILQPCSCRKWSFKWVLSGWPLLCLLIHFRIFFFDSRLYGWHPFTSSHPSANFQSTKISSYKATVQLLNLKKLIDTMLLSIIHTPVLSVVPIMSFI